MGSKKLALIFLVCVILAFISGMQFQRLEPPTEPGTQSDTMFEYITQTFKDYYYYDITDDEINQAFIAQMEAVVSTYGALNNDPYTRLVAQSIHSVPMDQEKFIGIGIQFQYEEKNLLVTNVYFQGPAYQKLYPNDLIIGLVINGQNMYFDELSNTSVVSSYLSGDLHEVKSFIVLNPDQEEVIVDITYEEILTPTAYSLDLNEASIGYIKIEQFSSFQEGVTEGTSKVFNDALLLLEASILDGSNDDQTLIIDLRNNPGGALSALSNTGFRGLIPGIVQQLLVKTDQPAFSMVNRLGEISSYDGGLTKEKPYEIVVLVNGRSASASEVLAATLSEVGGYELYGEPTFGKNVYQNTRFLQNINDINYSLTYTEGVWLYGDSKSVSTDPLPVNLIENHGYKTIGVPIYLELLERDDVSLSLIPFQEFLNVYYPNEFIRTDGYFDLETENQIKNFQVEHGLVAHGIIDLQTAHKIYDLYLSFLNDWHYDQQLLTLIDTIKG